MGNTFYFAWEMQLIEALQSIFTSRIWIAVWSFFSACGEEVISILVLGFFYWGYNKELGKKIGTNIVVNVVFNPFVKNIFLRRRPYFDNPSIKVLKPVDPESSLFDISAQGFSFPSGHSSNAMTIFGTLALSLQSLAKGFRTENSNTDTPQSVTGKRGIKALIGLLWLVPILVGISRFVLGVHYPTDVLGGWAMALVIIFFVPVLRKKIKSDLLFYGLFAVAAFPGFFFCKSYDFYAGYGLMLGAFLAFSFEERFVKFENTKNILLCILRTVIGIGLYLLLNTLLKMPFSESFLSDNSTLSYIVKAIRYTIVIFFICGIYPLSFKIVRKK